MNPIILDRLDAMEAWVHRRRWWIRLVAAVILVPWLAWFTYTRMTTMPPVDAELLLPVRSAVAAAPAPPGDRAAELVQAINGLPDLPALNQPTAGWLPAAGSRCFGASQVDFEDALKGEWTPATRYHLSLLVGYLQDPRTQATLKSIAALASQPAALPEAVSKAYPYRGGSFGSFAYLRAVTLMLLTRARGQMAGNQDFDAALADVRTALQLVANLEDDGRSTRIYSANEHRILILRELQLWSREFTFTKGQIGALQQLLNEYRLDWRAVWTRAVRGEAAFYESMLDQYYTRDAGGNGWPVIQRRQPDVPWNLALCTLNVLTPTMNDRATMQRKIQRSVDRLDRILDVSPSVFYRTMMTGDWYDNLTPADYVLADTDRGFRRTYWHCLESIVTAQGTATCLALAAYRQDHGQYPASLDQLVPAYLPAVPVDPCTTHPLKYRLDDKYDYLLYSLDTDGKDNSDQMLSYGPGYWGYAGGYGVLFCMQRQQPENEWEHAPTASPAATTGNKDGNDQGQ